MGSAQCRSSTATTSGRGSASCSRTWLTAQKVSSLVPGSPPCPMSGSRRSTAATSSVPPGISWRRACRVTSSDSSPSSSRGLAEQLDDRPVGDALAVGHAAPAQHRGPVPDPGHELGHQPGLADARSARSPSPGGRDRSRRSGRARPRGRGSRGPGRSARRRSGAAAPSPRRRRPRAGRPAPARALPLATTGSTSSTCTASRTRAYVASPSSTSPAPAACSSRAAVLTASPVANEPPARDAPATTEPVLTPVRISRRHAEDPGQLLATAPATACPSSCAARTARRASSSRTSGTPKTASTASPTNFSTVPPCRSTAARDTAK